MNINRVKIKNFKSLKDIDVNLSHLNLLTGVNSSGKSSFIQALLLLKQNENYFPIDYGKQPLIIKGDYVNLGNKKDILFQEVYDENIEISIQSSIENFATLTFNNKDLKFDFDTSGAYISKNISTGGIVSINIGVNVLSEYNLFDESFQYITTERIAPKITYPLSDEIIEQNQIGIRGEYTAHYLATYRLKELQIDALKHPQSITNHLLENVSLWLSEISENIEVKAKVYEELQSVDLKYTYTYGKTTTQDFTPLNVGFGITYVLPIITAILKAKKGDLIIIENPETHLHPKAQSKIARLCSIAASNGIQIILETHSDHILNGIRVATKERILKPEQSKIYYFIKDKDNLETKIDQINIDNNGAIDRYPKGFFDQFDEDLDRLIVW